MRRSILTPVLIALAMAALAVLITEAGYHFGLFDGTAVARGRVMPMRPFGYGYPGSWHTGRGLWLLPLLVMVLLALLVWRRRWWSGPRGQSPPGPPER